MTAPDTTEATVSRGALGFEIATAILLILCVALSVLGATRDADAGTPGYLVGAAISPLLLVGVPYLVTRLLAKHNKRRKAAIVALVLTVLILLGRLGSLGRAAAATAFVSWPEDLQVAAESSAAHLARAVGHRPDEFLLCERRRIQISFTNLPGDPPIRFHGDTIVSTGEDRRKRDTVIQKVLRASWPALAGLRFDTLTLVLRRTSRRSARSEMTVHVPRDQAPFDDPRPMYGVRGCWPGGQQT